MKKWKKFVLIFGIIFLASAYPGLIVFGDIPPPCDDPDADPCNCIGNQGIPESCPIDGGVVALLAAGVGLGILRISQEKKKSIDGIQ